MKGIVLMSLKSRHICGRKLENGTGSMVHVDGDDITTKSDIINQMKFVQLFMNTGLRSHLTESSTVACHSFEFLFGALPNNICETHHSQHCCDCDRIVLQIEKLEFAVLGVHESRLLIINESIIYRCIHPSCRRAKCFP